MNELAILRHVRHPNIIRLMDHFDTPRRLFIVMELVSGGDLVDVLIRWKPYTEVTYTKRLRHSYDTAERERLPVCTSVCVSESEGRSIE